MSSDYVTVWDRCLSIIKDNVQEANFDKWFKPIVPLSLDNNVLNIQVPSYFFVERLEGAYLPLLKSTLCRVFGNGIKLRYTALVIEKPKATVTQDSTNHSIRIEQQRKKTDAQPSVTVADPFRQPEYCDLDPQLNPVYTFDSYYSGESNKLARTAAESIASDPGNTPFNPLFLFGESGVGKTHLIQAIGIKIKENNPRARVLYISSHLFLVQYTNAVRNNTVNDFINFYQSIDVLLMDDIQEFAGKQGTQNTFFHIFNHLHQNKKQLVLTSDRPPVELDGMLPRLLTRFKWGLTAKVERPDYELRRNILMNKVVHDGLAIPEPVIDYIARNVTDNVRDLEGIIVSLMAHATIFNREVDIDLADRVLSNSVKIEKKQITAESIKDTVCGYFNIEPRLLQAKSRKSEIVQARHISMFLAKKYTELSLACIGDVIGKRDHATVLHACKTIGERMAVDKSLKAALGEIEELLQK